MQGDLERRWNKAFKQLIYLFLGGLVHRWKVRARNLRIADENKFGNVVYACIPLHFHHADGCFSVLGRKRNRHSPTQVLEVFPVIDLRLINNEPCSVLVFFAWPARVARLIGSGVGGDAFERQRKKRCANDHALNQRSARQFHSFELDRLYLGTPVVPVGIGL